MRESECSDGFYAPAGTVDVRMAEGMVVVQSMGAVAIFYADGRVDRPAERLSLRQAMVARVHLTLALDEIDTRIHNLENP